VNGRRVEDERHGDNDGRRQRATSHANLR